MVVLNACFVILRRQLIASLFSAPMLTAFGNGFLSIITSLSMDKQ